MPPSGADEARHHPAISLTGGGEARLVRIEGERVTLESTRAFPPGAPLGLALEGLAAPVRVKVRGSRRRDDGWFQVEGRLVGLTREQRARLEGASPTDARLACRGAAQASTPASDAPATPAEPAEPAPPPAPDTPAEPPAPEAPA